MKMKNFVSCLAFVLFFCSSGVCSSLVTMVLVGQASDPYSIQITKDFSIQTNNISFRVCNSGNQCRTLGTRAAYDNCQIKELVKTPLWAVFVDGGEAFSKASSSWAGFAKALVSTNDSVFALKHINERSPIRVTDLMFPAQANLVSVQEEAVKIETVLAKVDDLSCN